MIEKMLVLLVVFLMLPADLIACTLTLGLKNCNSKTYNTRFTYFNYYEELETKNDCPDTKINEISWWLENGENVQNFENFNEKVLLIINKNTIPEGVGYKLFVKASLSNGVSSTYSCLIDFLGKRPEIIFGPETSKVISPKSYIIIDVTPSKNIKRTTDAIKWSARCFLKKARECSAPNKCAYDLYGLKLKLRHDSCSLMLKFQAKVNYGREIIKNEVYVHIDDGKHKIKCVENCNKYVSTNRRTVFEIICVTDCKNFDSLTWKWSVVGGKFKNENLEVSASTKRATIRAGILEAATIYAAHVNPNTIKSMYTSLSFETAPIKMKKATTCTVEPREGESLVTVFTVNCSLDTYFQEHPPIFQVFQESAGESIFLLHTSFPKFELLLQGKRNPTQRLKVIVVDDKAEKTIATVPSIMVYTRKAMDFEKMATYVTSLVTKGNYPKVIQYDAGFVPAIKSAALSNKLKNTYYGHVLNQLKKIIDKDITSSKVIVNLMPKFYENPNLNERNKKRLSSLCNKLSEILRNEEEEEQEQVAANFGILTKCGDALLNKKKDEKKIVITTPDEYVEETFTENYPNYDEDISSMKMDPIKLQSVKIIENAGQTVANRLPLNETEIITGENTQTLISRNEASNLVKNNIIVSGVSLKVNNINCNEKDITRTVITGYLNNKLIEKPEAISTTIVDINVFVEKKHKRREADVQFSVTLNILHDIGDFQEFSITVPTDRNLWTSLHYKDKVINIHRLNLPKHSSCFIKFYHLQKLEKLRVVFTQNRRPNLKDFDKETFIVDGGNPKSHVLICDLKKFLEDDHFVYVAILPHEDMLKNSAVDNFTMRYNVQFSKQFCLYYDEGFDSWIVAQCKVEFLIDEGKGKIRCTCTHLTLFGGKFEHLQNKLEEVLDVVFVTEKFVDFIIFAHVAIVFLCYCIALIFSRLRMKNVERVYFLSDNMKNDRYAYLIIVRTGSLTYSGTTSNVVIQLFGDKCDSKPHVLNYPDPDKKLLQRDKTDWFVLTNDKHLGDVKAIDLWFDSIGLRAPWYCEHVSVLDLQQNLEWQFSVNKWLILGEKGSHKVTVECSKKIKATRKDIAEHLARSVRFYVGGHHTWNIFSTNHDYEFLYHQRLTIILSMIYTTYAFTLLCFGTPTLTSVDIYSYGSLRFHYELVFIILGSCIFASLINVPFVFLFRNSQPLQKSRSFVQEKKLFSAKVTIITWAILCSWLVFCLIYLILLGFWVTRVTGYLWIICTATSLLINIILMENIVIVIMKIIHRYVLKPAKKFYDTSAILQDVEKQRLFLYKTFGEVLMRPYFRKHYRPLTSEEIKRSRKRQEARLRVIALFRDMCLYLTTTVFLYMICLLNSDSEFHKSNKMMLKMMDGNFSKDHFRLNDTITINDVYTYIRNTVIPVTHSTHWYGNYYVQDPGLMIDFNTKVLGVIQLRQQRYLHKHDCESPEALRRLNVSCPKDTFSYDKWAYSDGHEISKSMGILDTYSGSGYIAHLGRTLYNAYYTLGLLEKENWLDNHTRVLFIEFWTYNVNYNLFSAVRVNIEREKSGIILKFVNVITTRFLFASIFWGIVYVLLIIGFICSITIIMLVILVNARSKFFKNFWNLVDILLLIVSLVTIVLLFKTEGAAKILIDKLEKSNHNEFVSYFHLFTLSVTSRYLSAAHICVATIRLLKYVEFGKMFLVMAKAFKWAIFDIMIFNLFHVFVFFMFGSYLFIMYGHSIWFFRTVWASIITQFLCSLNLLDDLFVVDLIRSDYFLCFIYFLITMCSIGFLSLYCTILMMSIRKSRTYYSNKKRDYTIGNFFRDEATYHRALIKITTRRKRLKGGADLRDYQDKLVIPKEPTKRYADCLSVDKKQMRLMRLAAIAVIKKFSQRTSSMTEDDFTLMAKLYLSLALRERTAKHENFMFFKGKDVLNDKIHFISNIKILQMEFMVRRLLRHEDLETTDDNQPIFHLSGDADRLNNIKDILVLLLKHIESIKFVPK